MCRPFRPDRASDVLSRTYQVKDLNTGKTLSQYYWVGAYRFAGEQRYLGVTGGGSGGGSSTGLRLGYGYSSNSLLGWDQWGRTRKQQWTNASGSTVELDRSNYEYDRVGNVTGKVMDVDTTSNENAFAESYAYDKLDRLVDWKRGTLSGGKVVPSTSTSTQNWSLDALGNWRTFKFDTDGGVGTGGNPAIVQTRTFNAVNEIQTNTNSSGTNWVTSLYDTAGNMTTAPKGQGSEVTSINLRYDAWNRVAGVISNADTDYADTGEVQYLYDGVGRRIIKDFASGGPADEDTYYNDQWQALETRQGGTVYSQTVWDEKYVDAPIVRYRDVDGLTTTGTLNLEETLYFTYDKQFNVTGLVKEDQTFVERYAYTPYGDRTVLTATFGLKTNNASEYDQRLGHQGLSLDAETGQWHNRARNLLSPTGTFNRRDPIGLELQRQSSKSLYFEMTKVPENVRLKTRFPSEVIAIQAGLYGGKQDFGDESNLYSRHAVLQGVDPKGTKVYQTDASAMFVALGGASFGIAFAWDDCGNSAFLVVGSARLGLASGLGGAGTAVNGCLKDFVNGNTLDITVGLGFISGSKHWGINGSGSGYTLGLGIGADLGLSGGYNGCQTIGKPILNLSCPCVPLTPCSIPLSDAEMKPAEPASSASSILSILTSLGGGLIW